MQLEKRLELIKGIAEEIITEEELRNLLEKNPHPVAYDGFEPSGVAHLGSGVLRAINLEDLQKAGLEFKILIADWHAWINNKLGGDLEKIQKAGEYFIEVWKAAGVKKVEIVRASDIVQDEDYWKKVILVAKNTTMKRAERAISIMGRKLGEMKETAQLFYPMMQVADIFHLDVDITQLGVDQRRACILAREISDKFWVKEKLGAKSLYGSMWKKPVVVSHHMLMGLDGVKQPEGYDENEKWDVEVSSKMSKSKPESAIFVHDSEEDILRKISKAFCPQRVVENNPVLEYNRYIIFRKMKEVKIERDSKFGGEIIYESYQSMEDDFRQGRLHPVDLKNSTARNLDKIIAPVRNHFEKNVKARNLYSSLKRVDVTR